MPSCIVNAVQDDISSKAIRLSLHDPVEHKVTGKGCVSN